MSLEAVEASFEIEENSIQSGSAQSLLTGWGRTCSVLSRELCTENLEAASAKVMLSRGLARSYGDASLPPSDSGPVLNTSFADRVLEFDPNTGRLRAEAGLSLSDLFHTFLPKGYFTPVTPGTQFVTLGGCVASDVHGKNHHRDGSFGEHVERLRLRVADGRIIECSPEQESELFYATIGGMGLTGHILEVELSLSEIPSPWIWQEVERFDSLASLLPSLKAASEDWPFSVAWLDCLGKPGNERGLLMLGRWATPEEAPKKLPKPRKAISIPFNAPTGLLNPWTARLNNSLHFHTHRDSAGIVHPEPFFYPLDRIHNWNRLYGRRGFIQYQCVLPHEGDGFSVLRFFDLVRDLGGHPYLCVLKDFGNEGGGMLSFPKPGFTICIDLPCRGERTQQLVDRLNEFVIEEEGRIYLSKDAHTSPEHFGRMEPRFAAWDSVRKDWDPETKIRSALSVRLFGDRP